MANTLIHFAYERVFEDEEQAIGFRPQMGSGISSNREHICREFLKGDWTHLFFNDEDNAYDYDVLHSMLRRKLPIVGCNYKTKGPEGFFMAVGLDGERIPTTVDTTGVQRVVYSGFGVLVMERDVVQRVADAVDGDQSLGGLFPLGRMESLNAYATEDFGFAMHCASLGIPWHIDHDASKKVAHVGTFGYSWADQWSA